MNFDKEEQSFLKKKVICIAFMKKKKKKPIKTVNFNFECVLIR